MYRRVRSLVTPKLVKVVAAVVVGVSVGTLLPPDPVRVPGFGVVPALPVAAVGLALGGVLYVHVPRRLGTAGCGCSGDCGCS